MRDGRLALKSSSLRSSRCKFARQLIRLRFQYKRDPLEGFEKLLYLAGTDDFS